MKQKTPSSAKPKSPKREPSLASFRFLPPKMARAIDRIIGIQMDENVIVSARIILILIVLGSQTYFLQS